MRMGTVKKPRFSITFRITALIGFLVVAAAVFVGFWNYQILYKRLVKSELDELSMNTSAAKIRIEAQLGTLDGDLRFLNSMPTITGLIHAYESGGADSTEGDTLKQWQGRLQSIIDDMAVAKSGYYKQVEFVSLTEGVDSAFSNRASPESSGSNEAIKRPMESEFISDLFRLKSGEIYYSEFNFLTRDLHVTPDINEIFDLPVIWAAMPIFTSNGTPFGYVAINYSMKDILSRYAKTTTKMYSIYLVNKHGELTQIISGSDGGYAFRRLDIRQTYPKLLKVMESGSGILMNMGPDASKAISYTTVKTNSEIFPRELKVLLAGDYDSIIALSNTSRDIVFIITSLIPPILILVGLFVSKTITRPLRGMVDAILAFAEGEADVTLPPPAKDETGILVQAFENMRSEISRRTGLLEESETRHRSILATMADGLITIDEQGKIQTFNSAAEKIFGYSEEQIRGCNISKLMPEPESGAHDGYLIRYLVTGKEHIFGRTIERQGLRSDGVVFPMELSVNEIKVREKRSFIGIVRDITQRKDDEKDLQHSEAQLREAQRIANLGFWEEDLTSHAVFWSDEIYHMHEFTRDNFIPTREGVLNLIYPADLPGYKQAFQKAFEDDIPIDYECRSAGPGGQLLYLHIRGEVRRNEKGEPVQLFGTTLNITKPKLAEQAILRYKQFVDSSQDSITFFDCNYIFRDVNQRFLDRYGLGNDEVIGHTPYELDGAEHFASELKPQFDKGLDGNEINFQTWLATKSNGNRFLDINVSPHKGERGVIEGIIICARDITELKLVEEELRKSESMSLEAQRIGMLGFWEMEMSSRKVYWSDGIYAITGVNRDKFVINDQTFLNLIHPEDRERVSNTITMLNTEEGELQNLEFRILRHNDGRERHVLLRAGLSRNESGKPASMLGTMTDITEKVIAEHEIRRYRDIINATQDMMLFIDRDYRYLAVNIEFLNCYQLTADEVIGHHSADIIGKSQFENITKPLVDRALLGERVDHQHWFQYPERGSRYVFVSYNPYREDNGVISGVVVNVRDITDNKHDEMELQQAKSRAEEAVMTKARFLANMSHELRTPLNAIIGYSEMMYEKAEEIDDRESISDLDKIHSSGEHLLSLVNNILDLSKIEAGKMVLVQDLVNIRETIDAVTATFTPMLAVKGNRLILHIDDDVDTMITDAMRLRQCLFNLLSNAVKFTDNGVITLRVRKSTNKTNSWLIIEVRDTGIGISKENITRIFEAFDRAAMEYSETYGGTGLGLAIVNEIVHMMGGQISVISEPGHGSTFTLQLPYEEIILNTTPPDQPLLINEIKSMIDANGSKPLVLVIDDDPESLGILDWYLKKGGYQVITAENGDFGIRLARELHPVAIILDVLMPKRDGWDVLTELKSDPIMAHIPVIMCTVVDNATKGMALGASDYIVKPINRSLLLKTLKKYCTSETCRILVVDDDDATREMLDRVLTTSGWNVSTATNGSEAITALESQGTDLPDIILLDLMMPELDGYKVVEIVNKTNIWSNIPILIMTAKELTDADYDRLNGSVAGLLEKGAYSVDELLVQLNSLLLRENA